MPVLAPAVVFADVGQVEVRPVRIPEPGPEEVRVRTSWSGISQGTERWQLTGRYDARAGHAERRYPAVPGYQAAGTVEAVGDAVTDLAVGDPVMLQGTRFADGGEPNPGPGLGAHAALLVARADGVTPLAADVDLAAASLYRMAAVARHGARLTDVRPGDLVVVIGLGMIGQMAAQAARRRGARVIGADLVRSRVDAAAACSVDVAVHAGEESLEEAVRREAPAGADVVVDTTGGSRIFDMCVELVRWEGRICLQGYYPDPIPVHFHAAHLKRVSVTFPCGWDGADADREIAADLAARRLLIEPLITHRVPFREVAAAYDLVVRKPELTLGMVIDWAGAELQ